MTNEKAIVLLSQMYFPHFDNEEQEAITRGIKALAKDIGMCVSKWDNGTEHCPRCDANLTGMRFKYCVECGQKLKEGEIE